LIAVPPLRLASLATSPRGGEAGHDAQAQVLVDTDQPELQPLIARKGEPGGRVVDDLGLGHAVIAAQVCDPPLAGRLHVLIPGGVVAERPGDDEAIAQRPHSDRRDVFTARAPAAMTEDADHRHPAASRNEQDERVDEPCGESDDSARTRTEVDGVGCVAHIPRTSDAVRM